VTLQTVSVPDIGGTEGAEIVEISIAVGDTIEPEQAILVLETDKASMDVPCPIGGTVKSLSVNVGDKVSEGDALIEVEVAPAPAASGSSEVTVTVPEGAEGADIIELAVAEGDTAVWKSLHHRQVQWLSFWSHKVIKLSKAALF